MSKIKIFVGYHSISKLLKSNILYPILLGANQRDEQTKEFFKNYYLDNYKDNISEKNYKYCELTGLYNVWKNQEYYIKDSEYVGFFHYRRIFNFGNKFHKIRSAWYSQYLNKYFNKNKPDIIVPKFTQTHYSWVVFENETRNLNIPESIISEFAKKEIITIKDLYESVHIKEDFTCMMEGIKTLHPEIYKVAEISVNQLNFYCCNMFIAKKEIFNDMMSFIFSVLDYVEKERDNWEGEEYKHHYQQRVAGFLSERLMSIYISYLYSKKTYNIIEKKVLRVDEKSKKIIYKIFGFLK